MKLLDSYLNIIQNEYGYANPIQTRPKPEPGITNEDPEEDLPPGVRGPSGNEVDLDKDTTVGYDFRNFSQADYNYGGKNEKNKAKKNDK